MAVRECPLASRWSAKLLRRVQKSLSLFYFLNLRKFSTISPLKQLVGCIEIGGMYRYKFIDFWKVHVTILPLSMVYVRSRQLAVSNHLVFV